jgi:hypothetical protein
VQFSLAPIDVHEYGLFLWGGWGRATLLASRICYIPHKTGTLALTLKLFYAGDKKYIENVIFLFTAPQHFL